MLLNALGNCLSTCEYLHHNEVIKTFYICVCTTLYIYIYTYMFIQQYLQYSLSQKLIAFPVYKIQKCSHLVQI